MRLEEESSTLEADGRESVSFECTDIPSMALSSSMSAVLRRGAPVGERREVSDKKSVEVIVMREDRLTRGGDGSASNWAR